MTTDVLSLTEEADRVFWLQLERPAVHNALDPELVSQLTAALIQLHEGAKSGEVNVVVLSGAGDSFCSGADLHARGLLPIDEQTQHRIAIQQCCDALAVLPCPTAAVLHGAVLGGGFELALACDVRICTADAVLGFPEVAYGIFPGAGGPRRLVRAIGESRARYLLMTASRVTGREAFEYGCVNLLADLESLRPAACELATRMATFPPAGIRALKEFLDLVGAEPAAEKALGQALRGQLDGDAAVQESFARFVGGAATAPSEPSTRGVRGNDENGGTQWPT